jgi:predicted  nucleic acid-binding Zn-ribbon protein
MTESLQESQGPSAISVETSQLTQVASSNTISIADLITTLQKVKKEEQDLTEKKQTLQTTENNLRNKIVDEIYRTNNAIESLKSEVSSLEDKCNELSRALGYQPSKII